MPAQRHQLSAAFTASGCSRSRKKSEHASVQSTAFIELRGETSGDERDQIDGRA